MEGLKNMKNKKINKTLRQAQGERGFTLIELIVSITIIAVVTVVAAVSFNGVGSKSRDARRMADLEKIRMALEMIKQQSVGATYPANINSLVPTYIQSLPVDPKTGSSYSYNRITNYTYTLQTVVENAGSSNVAGGIYRLTNP